MQEDQRVVPLFITLPVLQKMGMRSAEMSSEYFATLEQTPQSLIVRESFPEMWPRLVITGMQHQLCGERRRGGRRIISRVGYNDMDF
jgi:hypothetical protein